MRRLGIISCQVFEKELAHLLDKRPDISDLYMEKTPENLSFSKHINVHDVQFIRDPDFLRRIKNSIDVIVKILPIGLHIDINELEDSCNEAINRLKHCTSAILLFYGLCGKGLEYIIKRDDVKLVYPCDEEGIVDDCVCSVLGRNEYFRQLQRMGSYFLIPGMVGHRDNMLKKINERTDKVYTSEMTRQMFEINDYKRALLVHEGIESEEDIENAYALAKEFELPVEHTTGDLSILECALNRGLEAV